MRTLKYAHSFEVAPSLLPELEPLRRLAGNFRWSWDRATEALFEEADPAAWKASGRNPVQLVAGLSDERQQELAEDHDFLARQGHAQYELDAYLTGENWFDQQHPGLRDRTLIAYFCAEFGIHESLPIYSGGLGVLAGDHLKAASDLGLPLVGVGLLYQRGYFRQQLMPDGWQQERYPDSDFYKLPLALVRGEDGQALTVAVDLADRKVSCQIWKAQVGRVELYLLDSNLLENEPHDQAITDTLYGGDEEMRIRQEIILGIGGFKALRAIGLKPTVCHMNEGHAAFLTLERLRDFIEEHGCDFKTARQCVVAGNVFTTHTPVPAGFDVFTREMLARYLSGVVAGLGISFDQFLDFGRVQPDSHEPFNMALLALSNSWRVNGVSRLHARVTREMFGGRWPDFPLEDIPIDAVTNGIHTPSWIGPEMSALLDKHVPAWRKVPASARVWQEFSAGASDEELLDARAAARQRLVRFVRSRIKLRGPGDSEPLDAGVLTIGFARRFATYKRATLLFQDRERLKRIVNREAMPVQFVFAGKAHPRDDGGKRLIQDIKRFIEEENLGHRMVFIEDYDIGVAREMIQGVDVWLNNPRRPQEASGTSGMKVVPNGGLNCSILDGWWAEGYAPESGWAIGDEFASPDEGHQDWLDSQSLYDLLENRIAPLFYDPSREGWLKMVRASMARLAPEFSTERMVREYAENCYLPASAQFLALSANNQARARDAEAWRARVASQWSNVAIERVESFDPALREAVEIRAVLCLGGLQPSDLKVELLCGLVGSNREIAEPERYEMALLSSEEGRHSYRATIQIDKAGHYGTIVRAAPHHPDVRAEMELPLVIWQESKESGPA